jgi:formate/nitrite transporter FocA (FNT family)
MNNTSSKEDMNNLLDLLNQLPPQMPPKHLANSILQKVNERHAEKSKLNPLWVGVAAAFFIGMLSIAMVSVIKHQKNTETQLLQQMVGNTQNQLYHE